MTIIGYYNAPPESALRELTEIITATLLCVAGAIGVAGGAIIGVTVLITKVILGK